MASINDNVRKYIEKNISLLDTNDYEELYTQATVPVNRLTEALITAGIDPQPYMLSKH